MRRRTPIPFLPEERRRCIYPRMQFPNPVQKIMRESGYQTKLQETGAISQDIRAQILYVRKYNK